MGHLTERLKARGHPLFPLAKDLVRAAARVTFDGEDEDDFLYELDEQMLGLGPDDIEVTLALAVGETELMESGEEVAELLAETAKELSQELVEEFGEGKSTLFAVPLCITGPRPRNARKRFTRRQEHQLSLVLRDSKMLAEDSEVTLFPRLLSVGETARLHLGDAYWMTRFLSQDEKENGLEIVERYGEPDAPGEAYPKVPGVGEGATGSVFMVLAGVVACQDRHDAPFVLARAFMAAHDDLPGPGDEAHERAHVELHEEHEEHLAGVAIELSTVLQVAELSVPMAADTWHENRLAAFSLQRDRDVSRRLRLLADLFAGGDLSKLILAEPREASGQALYPVVLEGGGEVGTFTWPEAPTEAAEAAFIAMLQLLNGLGVRLPMGGLDADEKEPRGPLH